MFAFAPLLVEELTPVKEPMPAPGAIARKMTPR
jgi:hypothetical protein